MDEDTRTNSLKRKKTGACDPCRRRKIKCDGKFPCSQCAKNSNHECVYVEARKRGPKIGQLKKLKEENNLLREVLMNGQLGTSTSIARIPTALTVFNGESRFVHAYFMYDNSVVPIIDEDSYHAKALLQTKGEEIDEQDCIVFKFLHYSILSIGARQLHYFDQAKEFYEVARNLGSQYYDQPSEEAAAAFSLLGCYALGSRDLSKATMYMTIAINMCRLVNVRQELWLSLQFYNVIGFLGLEISAPPIPFLPGDNFSTVRGRYMHLLVQLNKELQHRVTLPMNADKVDKLIRMTDEILDLLDHNPGSAGPMQFSTYGIVYGTRAIVYKLGGNMAAARTFAHQATSSFSHELAKFCCPMVAQICLRLAKIHRENGEYAEFSQHCKLVEHLAATWNTVDYTYKRFRSQLELEHKHTQLSLQHDGETTISTPENHSSDSDLTPKGIEELIGSPQITIEDFIRAEIPLEGFLQNLDSSVLY